MRGPSDNHGRWLLEGEGIAVPGGVIFGCLGDLGADVWMRPLGLVAEAEAWMHFHNVAEVLRYLHSQAGGSLRHLKHDPM